jgi:uncharacterized protein YndB with AHSA1/START domain
VSGGSVATGSVEIRRLLPASPEEVFRWWTQADLLAQWMSPVGSVEAVVDLRVGGRFRIVMSGGGMTIDHSGEYLEVDPPKRVVFTWVSPYTGARPSVVTVELVPAAGGTELFLSHRRLPIDAAESHQGGWGSMLDRLVGNLNDRGGH